MSKKEFNKVFKLCPYLENICKENLDPKEDCPQWCIDKFEKKFTLVGELNDREFDIPEYSNINMHFGESDEWDIDDEEFEEKEKGK